VTLLSLDRVSLSFRHGRREVTALNDVSLEVSAGELVAVYGKAAAGKTSLLKVAAGFTEPDRGRVLFDGMDLARCSRGQRAQLHRNDIGWVQRAGPRSDELPIAVYVALALYRDHGARDAQRRAVVALGRVGVAGLAGERWKDLSDTDRMLVAIAQAYAHRPSLLVVDDPTYGFALADRERVVGLLRTIAEEDDIGVLAAFPDMPALLPAHELRLLHRGRLVAPADLTSPRAGNVVRFPRTG
jgi:putative ABC transport system ATP-binding protein